MRMATDRPLIGSANATLFEIRRMGVDKKRKEDDVEEEEEEEEGEGLGEHVCVMKDSVIPKGRYRAHERDLVYYRTSQHVMPW